MPFTEFTKNRYDCLYMVYLHKLLPKLYHVLTPAYAKDRDETMDESMRASGLNTILEHMRDRYDGLPLDEYYELKFVPYEHRVEALCRFLRDSCNPWMFHCFLEALQFNQTYYFKNCVKKYIARICVSFYNGLINSVFELGHTMSLGGDIRLNIFATHNGEDIFVDIRRWKGEHHQFPTPEGVCMSDEQFRKLIEISEKINNARQAHGFHALQHPCTGLPRSTAEKLWKIGPQMIVLLTGCPKLLPGHFPGVTLIDGVSNKDPLLRFCRPGVEKSGNSWNVFSILQRKDVKKLSKGGQAQQYRGRKKYVALK